MSVTLNNPPGLEKHLAEAKRSGRKIFVPYLTAGLPSPQGFVSLVHDFAKSADAIEVGIPFSDPIMDGPVIQEASSRALEAGTTVEASLNLIRQALREVSIDVLVMTYFNPVHRMGLDRFAAALRSAGVSGLIVPDLPLEESGPLQKALKKADVALVQMVAPMTSSDRAALLAKSSRGFVYAVSRMGVTGERDSLALSADEVVKRVRPHTDLPILLGIGISNTQQARDASELADGVVVGTAIMSKVMLGDSAGAVGLVREIRKGLDGG